MQDLVNRERALSEWLRQVADADAASGASPAVRERLLEEVRARRRMRRTAAIKMYAMAAGLVMATALPVWQLATRPAIEESQRVVTSAAGDAVVTSAPGDAEVATAFYPLAYGAVPVTRANIVRVAVSPAAVAALGVEPPGGNTSPTDVLLADVVVGEDGLARAVRFVRTLPRERRSAVGSVQEQQP
jgi:hypothetical protein